MEEAITARGVKEDEKLKQMYARVVGPNQIYVKKGFIKCPDCGEQILITPTLRKMNEAIENHIQLHKKKIESKPLLNYTKPIIIRLALARQILETHFNTAIT
jgi:hypothetical protein